ncbi:hypothetical protein KR026_009131, partial [Drosophila bipectinata]
PPGSHRYLFKPAGFDPLEARSRRHEVTVELRKSKREEAFMKRRNITWESLEDDSMTPQMMDTDDNHNQDLMLVGDVNIDNINILCDSITPANNNVDINTVAKTVQKIMGFVANCDNERGHIMGLQCARKLLGCLQDPPIDMMIQHGILPCCVDFLKRNHNPKLQLEAAWTLTNVTSGNTEQTMAVVKSGAVAPLMALLRSESTDVVEQVLWALSNISAECRDLVYGLNIIDEIMPLLEVKGPITYNRNLTWLISILCRSEMDSASFAKICKFLPHLMCQLCNPLELGILSNTIWAFTYLTDHSVHQTQVVLETGALPWIVGQLTIQTHISVLMPALRCVENVIAKTEDFGNYAISVGCLPYLGNLLEHEKPMVVKRTVCIFTQLSYNQNQIQAMLEAKIYAQLAKILSNGDFRIQREVVVCICNTITFGTPHQTIAMVDEYDIFLPFIKLLDSQDTRILIRILTGIEGLFNLAENLQAIQIFTFKFEEKGGLERLEKLKLHYNEAVHEMSVRLIESYYPDDDNMEAPQSVTQQAHVAGYQSGTNGLSQ